MVLVLEGTQERADTLATMSQFASINTKSQNANMNMRSRIANTIMRIHHDTAVRKAKRNLITFTRNLLVTHANQARMSLNTNNHCAIKKRHVWTAAPRTKIAWTASPNRWTYWAVPPSPQPSPSKTPVGATSCQESRAISHASAHWVKTVNAKEKPSATMCSSGCSIIMMGFLKSNPGSGLEREKK